MSAYRICEDCGAALDPGERCDCRQTGWAELDYAGGAGSFVVAAEIHILKGQVQRMALSYTVEIGRRLTECSVAL